MALHNHSTSNGLAHDMCVGEEGAGAGAGGSGSDESGGEEELSLVDEGAPARALSALNALRKARQHYDVVLVAGGGELPAHRAVLAAAAPQLLAQAEADARVLRLPAVPPAELAALLDYLYTGRLAVRDSRHARALYAAAARLRLDAPRDHLAASLLRRLRPAGALAVRALPDLPAPRLAELDAYIRKHFDEICASGALASLPEVRIEMMRETSASDGIETAGVLAEAARAWLAAQPGALDELAARAHLVYVDAAGALRDCGDLPPASGDAPELQQYRREAAARRRAGPPAAAAAPGDGVLAARADSRGGARALVALLGRLAAVRLRWSDVAGGGAVRGGALGGEPGGERRARMADGRAALGCAALAGRLLVCGGYDRARVLRACEAYCPARDAWEPAPELRAPRARFPAARLGDAVFALGGSDGHAELDSVEAFRAGGWEARARLPLALSHAGAAADEARGELYVVGGWAGGAHLRRVLRYSAARDEWAEAPALGAARAQCGAVVWAGALWALGGCDAWHCLASTERLALGAGGAEGGWAPGPALPTARRSVGACVWRGRLVSAGGSDGAASLRRVEWLETAEGGWVAGPGLRRPRAALGLAVLDDALFAAGGFDGKEFLSCVECLLAPDGAWTELRAAPAPRPAPAPAPDSDEPMDSDRAALC